MHGKDIDEFYRRWRELLPAKRNRKISSKKELDAEYCKLGKFALEKSLFYCAFIAYREAEDRKKVKEVAELALSSNNPKELYNASDAFEYLRDREGLVKTIKKAANRKNNDEDLIHHILEDICRTIPWHIICEKFKKWADKKGYPNVQLSSPDKCINLAYNLADRYDFGLAIAKGGLPLGYFFDTFELKTGIAEAHKKGKSATFHWVNGTSLGEFAGRRIAVFDKDVFEGNTSRRVLSEVQKYNPQLVDLVLIHNPTSMGGWGTIARKIPKGFNNVYYPKKFSYASIGEAIEKLEKKLGIQYNAPKI